MTKGIRGIRNIGILKCLYANMLKLKIKENRPLAPYTNYKIGGPARYFCEISLNLRQKESLIDAGKIIKALEWAKKRNLPIFILGKGTNILVSDKGFPGLVIRLRDTRDNMQTNSKIQITNNKQILNSKFQIQNNNSKCKITIGAGVLLSNVVNFALKNGLQGLEWAAGIPGTVGGAVRGNAGAFGSCMADVIKDVKVIMLKTDSIYNNNATKFQISNFKLQTNNKFQIPKQQLRKTNYELKKLVNKEMNFKYRSSIIKEKGGIILGATLKLKKIKNNKEKVKIIENANKYINYRRKHHPLEYPSCGSVFKNIEHIAWNMEHGIEEKTLNYKLQITNKSQISTLGIIPVAVLIAKAGLVGKKIGGAQISEKHSNFIINLGNAKAKDVLDLIKLCQEEVYKKFGVRLEREVELVGF
jgi:UDP-N-acetylmuramate dehydrogenase